MPKMFMRVKDSKTKKVYYFQWSTISDDVNSDVVDADSFDELHHQLSRSKFKTPQEWAEAFAKDRIQLGKTNVSNPDYTRAELLSASDEHKTVKSLLEFCKANVVKITV
jgi:hypothetical protein